MPKIPKGWRKLKSKEKQTVNDWWWLEGSGWRKNSKGCLVYPITKTMPLIRRTNSLAKTPNE
jgi:hypothetical protein